MSSFNYQMDAISANWPIHLGGYIDYLVYQVEWVTGKNGYVRWMLNGNPLYEVTTDTITKVPQNVGKTNPVKVMLEEPMYIIMNVALSSSWGASPPNPGSECRGDGTNDLTNRVCDDFPMYMKVDYVRLYQDLGDDLPDDSLMQVGCDPKSHPTREWIEGHMDEFSDFDNPAKTVYGKAFCKTNDDCTIGNEAGYPTLRTGICVESRCACSSISWSGPRCTEAMSDVSEKSSSLRKRVYGPPMGLSLGIGSIVILLSIGSVWSATSVTAKAARKVQKTTPAVVETGPAELQFPGADLSLSVSSQLKDNYRHNFV
ncbi:unnamed protein product [Hyaloperonospora brassicae]|nr:unnamed protein product [Hyaloperonospora brassicae]